MSLLIIQTSSERPHLVGLEGWSLKNVLNCCLNEYEAISVIFYEDKFRFKQGNVNQAIHL